jgi:hypothetical protein
VKTKYTKIKRKRKDPAHTGMVECALGKSRQANMCDRAFRRKMDKK